MGGQDLKKISRNMFKDVSNVNRIRSSIRRNLENYIHSIYYKGHCYKTRVWTDFRVRVSGQK